MSHESAIHRGTRRKENACKGNCCCITDDRPFGTEQWREGGLSYESAIPRQTRSKENTCKGPFCCITNDHYSTRNAIIRTRTYEYIIFAAILNITPKTQKSHNKRTMLEHLHKNNMKHIPGTNKRFSPIFRQKLNSSVPSAGVFRSITETVTAVLLYVP